jgi:hypothetical protein
MKSLHVVGISCLVVAVLCYVIAAASIAGGVFAFLGFVFELVAVNMANRIPDSAESKSAPASIKVPRRRR